MKKFSNEFVGERLKVLIKMTNMALPKLATKYDIPLPTFKAWVYNQNKLNQKAAENLLRMAAYEGVECSIEWLFTGKGKKPSYVVQQFHDLDYAISHELTAFFANCKKPIYLLIEDARLEPAFYVGDCVAGDAANQLSLNDAKNQLCLIKKRKKDKLFAGIVKPNKKTIFLESLNPDYEDFLIEFNQEDIEVITPILWMRRINL